MKQYTIRGLPEFLEEKVARYAEEHGISVNKAFIQVLEESVATPPARRKPLPEGLMKLFGAWNERQAKEFGRALAEQRQVDEELWRDV